MLIQEVNIKLYSVCISAIIMLVPHPDPISTGDVKLDMGWHICSWTWKHRLTRLNGTSPSTFAFQDEIQEPSKAVTLHNTAHKKVAVVLRLMLINHVYSLQYFTFKLNSLSIKLALAQKGLKKPVYYANQNVCTIHVSVCHNLFGIIISLVLNTCARYFCLEIDASGKTLSHTDMFNSSDVCFLMIWAR